MILSYGLPKNLEKSIGQIQQLRSVALQSVHGMDEFRGVLEAHRSKVQCVVIYCDRSPGLSEVIDLAVRSGVQVFCLGRELQLSVPQFLSSQALRYFTCSGNALVVNYAIMRVV